MERNLLNSARPLTFILAVVLTVGASAAAALAQHHTSHTGYGQAGGVPYDLHYIDMTLMHHEQGVEMARLAEQKALNAQVKAFATKTAAGHERDTRELQRYRDTWYGGRPQTDHAQMTAHQSMQMDHGADPAELRAATGAAFDRLFLDTMAHHHQMAIDMSKEARQKAEHAEIRQFAAKAVARQQAEVAEMNRLKAALGGRAAARKPAPRKKAPAKKPAAHSGHHE